MLPSNSPVFIRASRLHDELFARELERARQVFADKGPHERAFNMEGKGVSVVDLVRAKRGLVPALRILLRPSRSLCLRVAFHHLDRHVAVAGEDKQPCRVGLVNLPVCALLFERGQPPCSDKPFLNMPLFHRSWLPASVIAVIPINVIPTNKDNTPSESSFFMFGSSVTRVPLLLTFERSHVDGEAVLHIRLEQSLVGFVDLLDRDDFNIGGDVVLAAKIEHLLSFGDAADVRA